MAKSLNFLGLLLPLYTARESLRVTSCSARRLVSSLMSITTARKTPAKPSTSEHFLPERAVLQALPAPLIAFSPPLLEIGRVISVSFQFHKTCPESQGQGVVQLGFEPRSVSVAKPIKLSYTYIHIYILSLDFAQPVVLHCVKVGILVNILFLA